MIFQVSKRSNTTVPRATYIVDDLYLIKPDEGSCIVTETSEWANMYQRIMTDLPSHSALYKGDHGFEALKTVRHVLTLLKHSQHGGGIDPQDVCIWLNICVC